MHETPASLLEKLRHPSDQEAWKRFVQFYTPLLFQWARGLGLQDADAADLVQEVFLVLYQRLPLFSYDRGKSFRAWLRTVTLNKWRDTKRRRSLVLRDGNDSSLVDCEDPAGWEAWEEDEYRQYLLNRALQVMRSDFQPTTWQACWEHVVNQKPAAEVAGQLGISADSVYTATSRVLRRLRQDLDGFLS